MDKAVVIIPHFNDLDRLARCLQALILPDGVGVTVVDNGSTGDVAAVVGGFPNIRLLYEVTPGAAAARNRGVAETDAPMVLFLDADCVPAIDWVETALTSGPGPVGGTVNVFHEGALPLTGAQAFEAVFAFDNARYIADEGFSVTANMVVARDVFDAVGPFRDGVSEDKDWGLRARAAGYPVAHAPGLIVGHPSRGDWPALARKWQRLTQESRALHRAERRSSLSWFAKALAMPISIVAHAPRILRSPDLLARERSVALATLIRLRCARMVWMLRS